MYIVKLSQAIAPEALPSFAEATAELFKTEPSRMQQLLARVNTQLTKPLPLEKAERMASLLRNLGVNVDIVELPAEAFDIPVTQADVQVPVQKEARTGGVLKHWPDILLIVAFLALISGVAMTFITGRSFSFIGQNVAVPTATTSASPSTVNQALSAAGASTPTAEVVTSSPVDDPVAEIVTEAETVLEPEAATNLETEGAAITVDIEPSVLVTPIETTPIEASTVEANPVATPEVAQEASAVATTEVVADVVASAQSETIAVEPAADVASESATIVPIIPEVATAVELPPVEEAAIESIEISQTNTPDTIVIEQASPALEAATSTPSSTTVIPTADLTPGRYLQAGAYSSVENATYQKETLERLGYSVTQAQDFNFVVLLIGPFEAADLGTAVSTLNAESVGHYIRDLP